MNVHEAASDARREPWCGTAEPTAVTEEVGGAVVGALDELIA
jgi:hypothetical protein